MMRKTAQAGKGFEKAIFLICLLCFGGLGQGASIPRFRITNVKGNILAWPPWSSEWQHVKSDDQLWEGTMIQVGSESSFTFELDAEAGFDGLKADSMKITINVPMVLRLQGGIPRRVTLEDYFVPRLPDVTQAKGAGSQPIYYSLREAWERFAATVLPQAVRSRLFDSALNDKFETSVSVQAKKIHIHYPTEGAIAITDKLPHEIRLSWRKIPIPDVSYGVRVWSDEEHRPPPLGYTREDYYTVRVLKEGTFFAQIITADGKWQSEVRRFSVVLPMVGRGQPPTRKAVIKPIPLQHPPKDFVYLTKKWPVSMTFEWERPNSAKGKQVYEFTLSDLTGKPLFKKKTGELSVSIRFSEPGLFRWSMSATPRDTEETGPGKIFSEVRNISLIDPGTYRKKSEDAIAALLSKQTRGVIYFSEGF